MQKYRFENRIHSAANANFVIDTILLYVIVTMIIEIELHPVKKNQVFNYFQRQAVQRMR